MSEQAFTLVGVIREISEEEQITDTFKKRVAVVTVDPDGKYPQHIPIEFVNDKTQALNGYEVGQYVSVAINLRGRQARDGRYWSSVQGWRIGAESEPDGMDQRPAVEEEDGSQDSGFPPAGAGVEGELVDDENLPF